MKTTLLLLAALLAGCVSAPVHLDPPLHLVPNRNEAWFAAEMIAYQENGDVYEMAPTGSMEPLLTGGDFIVAVPADFKTLRVGEVIVYDADWKPASDPYVVHRIVAIDGDGLIMSGDANQFSESRYRVTDQTEHGKVIGIWRPSKP